MRLAGLSSALAACVLLSSSATPAGAAPAPNPPARDRRTVARRAIELGLSPMAVDAAGRPRMVRATRVAPLARARAAQSATAFITTLSEAWGVANARMPTLVENGDIAVPGGTISRVQQVIGGMPVFGQDLRVFTKPGGALVGISGTLLGTDRARTAQFHGDEVDAITRAVSAIHKQAFDAHVLAATSLLDPDHFVGDDGQIAVSVATARRMWFVNGEALEPVWMVETRSTGPLQRRAVGFRTIVAAATGRIIKTTSLDHQESVQWRVWADADGRPKDGPTIDWSPHPTGIPDGRLPDTYTLPSLVTVPGGLNHPTGASAPDPWLPDGATVSTGNNVDSYADAYSPDGFSTGDIRATPTAPGVWDRAYDTTAEPLGPATLQTQASVIALFYLTNYMHDFWYDAGFTEAAGNAQQNNFGRGGSANDRMLAEAQDDAYAGERDNANMFTPSDGTSPTMQVYLSTGNEHTHTLTTTPAVPLTSESSFFGPRNFDQTADVVAVTPCVAPTGVTGKIAFAKQNASCTPEAQAQLAQQAGAVGMLYAITGANFPAQLPVLPKDKTLTGTTLPTFGITSGGGTALTMALTAGAVSAHMTLVADLETDGDLDNTTAGHEYGHYVHLRLSDCNINECGAMSEGWGDFMALMLVVRAGDNLDAVYPYGAWPPYSGIDNLGYFGIRRYPYSTDKLKSPLMFHHMGDDAALPTGIPVSDGGSNSEVHNAGEIWGNVMFNAYVALQKAHGQAAFDDTRKLMAKYVVAGLLMAPPDTNVLEQRDALLMAVRASSPADADTILGGFAYRGMGGCAVDTDDDNGFTGIVDSEGTSFGSRLDGAAAAITITKQCDQDDELDVGESATIRVPFTNAGETALTNVTFAFASPPAGLEITQAPAAVASIAPGESVMAEFDVKLTSAEPMSAGTLSVTASTPNGCETMTTVPFVVTLEADLDLAASATDTFDAPSIWTATEANTPWHQEYDAGVNSFWHGDDLGDVSDTSVYSPKLTVAAGGSLAVSFDHRYQFDFDDGEAYDGGVVEYSTDNGGSWHDVSGKATIAYDAELNSDYNNPIGGRMAFAGASAGYPAMQTVHLDFGTAFAGMPLQIRFRQGTDISIGAAGWYVDNVKFEGIEGTPFPALAADASECDVDGDDSTDGDDDGGCCQSGGTGAGGAGALSVLALAAIVRRRRPRAS